MVDKTIQSYFADIANDLEVSLIIKETRIASSNVASNLDQLVQNFSVAVDFEPLLRAAQEQRSVGPARNFGHRSSYRASNGIFGVYLNYYTSQFPGYSEPVMLITLSVIDRKSGKIAQGPALIDSIKDKVQIVLENSSGEVTPLPFNKVTNCAGSLEGKDIVPGLYRVKLQYISR